MTSDPLLKIINKKLEQDLSHLVFYPFGSDIWIFDYDQKLWVFHYENSGRLSFNINFFNDFFSIFSLEFSEYKKILKSWFIKVFEIHVLNVHRVNTNFEYILDGVINSKKYSWSLKKRHGYSYPVVKKFLTLKHPKLNYIELREYFGSPNDSQS